MLSVEVFYQLAVGAQLIPSAPSERIDLAYLFYLPFSTLFVSSDRFHERLAPYFLRGDQRFLWGPDLKDGLRQLNRHYNDLSEEIKETGLMKFAKWPPVDDSFLVSRIFDEHMPGWRDRAAAPDAARDPETDKRLMEEVKKWMDAPDHEDQGPHELEGDRFFSMQRIVSKKRGSWYQVPKDLDDGETREPL